MTRKKSTIEESRYHIYAYILVYRCEDDVNIIAAPAKHTSRIAQIGTMHSTACVLYMYTSAYTHREAHTIHLANGIMCMCIVWLTL